MDNFGGPLEVRSDPFAVRAPRGYELYKCCVKGGHLLFVVVIGQLNHSAIDPVDETLI